MDHQTVVVRLLVAIVMSGTVGLERSLRNKPAGLRTHLLVGLGSALITLTSIYMGEEFRTPGGAVDPTRIAANIVVGLGFLGAGTIVHMGSSIHGLTTAASLWATGAIGLAVGCGFYSGAGVTWVAMLIALHLLDPLEREVVRPKSRR
ncbi:MAG: MgtC/SapB family protein [Candidatus Coatesbacteria bacterium]